MIWLTVCFSSLTGEMRVVHPRTVAKPNTKKRELSVQLWTDIHGTVNVRLAKFVEEYEEWETVRFRALFPFWSMLCLLVA